MIDRKTALKQLKFLKSKGRPMRLAADGWKNDWQTLVAILLSARTRDEVTILTCEKMFERYPTPKDFAKLQIPQIKQLIRSINFYNNKSKNLFFMTEKIIEDFEGNVPKTVNELITLPGIGRKTANVFLTQKGGSHIGVDTHVNYISNYLGWTNSTNPDIIEKDLENLFPKSRWKDVNNTLVHFGKTYTSKKQKNIWLDYIKENVK